MTKLEEAAKLYRDAVNAEQRALDAIMLIDRERAEAERKLAMAQAALAMAQAATVEARKNMIAAALAEE